MERDRRDFHGGRPTRVSRSASTAPASSHPAAASEWTQPVIRGDGEILLPLDRLDLADRTFQFRVQISVRGLIDSIERHGQQIPIVVRPGRNRPAGERYQIVCGFRRVTALRSLGIHSARAVVRRDLTDEGAFAVSFLENERRRTLNDVDRGWAVMKYRQHHPDVPMERIAAQFGLRRTQAYRLLRLTTFPEYVQRAIAGGTLPATHALTLLAHFKDWVDEPTIRGWLQRIEAEQLSLSQLRSQLRGAPTGRSSEELRLFRQGQAGRTWRFLPVDVTPTSLSINQRESVIRQLEELLQLLRDDNPSAALPGGGA